MLHAHSFIPAIQIGGQAFADSVVLSFEDRRRRRGTVTTLGGLTVLVDLPEAPALGHGDAYRLEDGRLVEIVAEAEEILEVRGRDPLHLVRLAWHLGNRHLETEITGKWLRIRRDHVIADMLRGLGARVIEIEGPFQPEGGAYAHGGHDHVGHAHGSHANEGHDHASHDHASHDHASHGHASHSHAGHEHHDHKHHGHDHDRHEHGHEHGHDHKPAHRHATSDPAVTGPEEPRHDTSADVPQFR